MIENDLKEIIMNKIFFAKYLPIEGEIKKDDNALNPSNKKVVRVNAACLKNLVTPEWKKVKLFLCSRDIQVGDDIQHTSGENGVCDEIIGDALHFSGDIEGHYSSINQWFKVIGKISPDAVWVKEGMEFDKGELSKVLYYTDREPENHVPIDVCPIEGYTLSKTVFRIKCPTCKTYH